MTKKVKGGATVSTNSKTEGIDNYDDFMNVDIETFNRVDAFNRIGRFDSWDVTEPHQKSLTIDSDYDEAIVGVDVKSESVVYYFPYLLYLAYEELKRTFEEKGLETEEDKIIYCIESIEDEFRNCSNIIHRKKGLIPPILIGK